MLHRFRLFGTPHVTRYARWFRHHSIHALCQHSIVVILATWQLGIWAERSKARHGRPCISTSMWVPSPIFTTNDFISRPDLIVDDHLFRHYLESADVVLRS